MLRIKSSLKPWLWTALAVIAMAVLSVVLLSGMICHSVRGQLREHEHILPNETYDTILVLGCGVKPNGEPSDMLEDRLRTAVALYEQGIAPVILLSGDHEYDDYNEIEAMKRFCLEAGIPEQSIVCDRYGLSTYDSIVRAETLFGVKRAVIVTQKYHLYRALYIARKSGMETIGVDADIRTYRLQWYRDLREMLARCKDFYTTQRDVAPKYTTLT